jgi:hypothetical protein
MIFPFYTLSWMKNPTGRKIFGKSILGKNPGLAMFLRGQAAKNPFSFLRIYG